MTPLAIAHKKLKGDLNNSYDYDIDNDRFLYLCNDGDYCTFDNKYYGHWFTYISTVEEFINFKGECTKALVDIIEDNGKLYQVGRFYEFKDAISKSWEVGVLCAYENGKFKSKCGNKLEWYDSIMRCTGIMGAVVDAPVKLQSGKAYQFDYDGDTFQGIYSLQGDDFHYDKFVSSTNICTNIKPLTVEGK